MCVTIGGIAATGSLVDAAITEPGVVKSRIDAVLIRANAVNVILNLADSLGRGMAAPLR
jgi:hypothetical protein